MQKKRRKKRKINLKKSVFALVITTSIAILTSMARFGEVKETTSIAKVAIPVFSSSTIDLNNVYPNMDTMTYEIIVKNTKEALKSEVSLEYTIEINNVGNIPLDIKLYNAENGTNVGDNLLNNGKTESIVLEVGEKTQEYILKIDWDNTVENSNSYEYSGETSYIQIKTDVVQKD